MGKRERHIRIRLSESQFQALRDFLVEDGRTKSAIIREALNAYLVENRTGAGNRNRKEDLYYKR